MVLRLSIGRSESHDQKNTESGVYRVTDIIGTSPDSWEAAAKNAVETAAKTLRDLRICASPKSASSK